MRPEGKGGLSGLPGWERLRHGGLLLDATRLDALSQSASEPLDARIERQLRQRAGAVSGTGGDRSATSEFVSFVLEQVCGLDPSTGTWTRGTGVASSWGRRALTGEIVKPRHLWMGRHGGRLPVFLDGSGRLGLGRSRRIVSQVLGWLRAGSDALALVTNGRQWRLVFAGLDHDAWCEWDLDLWFEEGGLSPQVAAFRALLRPELWTPPSEDAAPPLLQAIRDTRKGQAELSEVLGERVREAVEILIRGHGEALSALVDCAEMDVAEYREYRADFAGVSPAEVPSADEDSSPRGAAREEIYRAACRVAMRLVVILFAESRELLPRDNALYHESYGLNGLREGLERAAARGGALAASFGAWPRVMALFRLVREGSHHPDLPVAAYGGDLFEPGTRDAADGLSRALFVFENACCESEVMPDRDVHEMLKLLTRTTMRIRQGRGSTRAVVPVDFSDLSSEYIGILYEGLLDYELKTAPAGDPVVFLSVGDQPALPLSRLEAMEDRALKTLFERFKKNAMEKGDESEEESESEVSEEAVDPGLEREAGHPWQVEADLFDSFDQDSRDDARQLGVREASPQYLVEGTADERQRSRARAEEWARHAARVAGLVGKPRGRDTPERRLAFESRLDATAQRLIARVVLPGEWYLVRWGGTRKGSGSFYTRPGLAIPTVQRTLRPLAYDPPASADGTLDLNALPVSWTPKLPEEILALTVCDPACGSGTFPLAALRYLTDALYASLQHHGRIQPDGERSLVRLLGLRGEGSHSREARGEDSLDEGDDAPLEVASDSRLGDELIPCPPEDERFEARLKAVLRRHVVERCIYAVDLDPLAVELCRLSLWIETMDRTLPFGFLDHKIKCGNALIGAWFDEFRHYPVMAWKNREGGDSNHTNGVHFEKGARTGAIKAFVKDRLTPDLKLFLQGRDLFQADQLDESVIAHDEALAVLADMHTLPVQDAAERARMYRERLLGSSAWRALKGAMDLWCACWFWPAEEIERAPLPSTFAEAPDVTTAVAAGIAAEMRFFHWELEFPDVFREGGSGFNAILGNPPWENLQANPEEFFANEEPLFRTYGRLAKNSWQRERFAASKVYEQMWLDYAASFKYLSNWVKNRMNPFGDQNVRRNQPFSLGKGGKALHDRWRSVRSLEISYSDAIHPFRLQMGRVFTYQLMLEQSISLLRSGGRCGFIIPSGLYSDAWSRPLREALLDSCQWEWLFGIENRNKIFPIHRSYKFNPVIIQKGGTTEAICTAFMRHRLEDWEHAEEVATSYTKRQIQRFSPRSRAILEIQSKKDLKLLEKIYANAVLLGDGSSRAWRVRYKLEFMMNTDAHLFPPRPQWEAKGYRPDEYSRWLLGDWRPIEDLWKSLDVDSSHPAPAEAELEEWLFDTTAGPECRELKARLVHGHLLKPGDVASADLYLRCAQPPYDRLPIPRTRIPTGVVLSREGEAWIREDDIRDVALPFYEGRMIGQYDYSQKGWVSGKGRSAVWREIPWHCKQIEPQYLMASSDYHAVIVSPSEPKVLHMRVGSSTNLRTAIASFTYGVPAGDTAASFFAERLQDTLALTAVMNSLVFDFVTRARLIGLHLDYHVLEQNPLPAVHNFWLKTIADIVSRLNFNSRLHASQRLQLRSHNASSLPLSGLKDAERTRLLAVLNALVAAMYRLDRKDILRIIEDCDAPSEDLGARRTRSAGLNPKGFWRVGRDKAPELRYTVLSLIAFDDLVAKIDAAGGDREKGVEAFLAQNNGEGWMLPETLRLADYGLGYGERARHPHPVASRLGPRFYDWQLVQSAEESWQECHLHARNLLGTGGYASLLAELVGHRAKEEDGYIGLLRDGWTRGLLGEEGYVAMLAEVCGQSVMQDDAYWTMVSVLRDEGDLDDSGFCQLLDQLHARGCLDDIGYRWRRGVMPSVPSAEVALRVAEPPAKYEADTRSQDRQSDLFE